MPKSILKKPPTIDKVSSIPAARSREDRIRETALYHANLIQHRKDIEALVLKSTETLLDLPSLPPSNPVNPSSEDALTVKRLLRPFQTSDYDALIEERNIDNKCGYVLCPRSNKFEDNKARFRILQSAAKGADAFKVVESQMLEKWCSDQCAKRALYIRVQLNEEPAWKRADNFGSDIVLLEDTLTAEQDQVAKARSTGGLEKLEVGPGEDRVMAAMKELAVERGDGNAVSRASRIVEVDIHEKISVPGKGPSLPVRSDGHGGSKDLHGSIEGYTPTFSNKTSIETESPEEIDDDDIIPTI